MDLTKEPELKNKELYPDICVCCGAPVPEGYMICPKCEHENETDEIEYFRPKLNHLRKKLKVFNREIKIFIYGNWGWVIPENTFDKKESG